MNADIINQFLDTFLRLGDTGFLNIGPQVQWLFNTLLVLSLTLAGLFWAFEPDSPLAPFLRKVLLIGFFAWVVGNWAGLTQTVAYSFAELGLIAGGNVLSFREFFSPTSVAVIGLNTASCLIVQAGFLTGPVATLVNLLDILILAFAILVVLIAFFVMAIQVLMVIVEFKLVTLAGYVLVPFAIFSKTTFLSERALGYVAAAGIKMMVLAIVISLSQSVFPEMANCAVMTAEGVNLGQALALMLASLVVCALALFTPALAAALITGGVTGHTPLGSGVGGIATGWAEELFFG
jgi:type IV secretion system protein TrbL